MVSLVQNPTPCLSHQTLPFFFWVSLHTLLPSDQSVHIKSTSLPDLEKILPEQREVRKEVRVSYSHGNNSHIPSLHQDNQQQAIL